MAARINRLRHDDETRARIQAAHLIKRLEEYALANLRGELAGTGVEGFLDKALSKGQIRAIEILLRKILPDLSNVTLSGDPDNPIHHLIERIERVIVDPTNSDSAGIQPAPEAGEV